MALATGLFASPAFQEKFGEAISNTNDHQVSDDYYVPTYSIRPPDMSVSSTLDTIHMASFIAVRQSDRMLHRKCRLESCHQTIWLQDHYHGMFAGFEPGHIHPSFC